MNALLVPAGVTLESQPGPTTDRHGDEATVVVQVYPSYYNSDRHLWYDGPSFPWRFRAVLAHGLESGWRIRAVEAPDVCAVYLKC